MSYIDKITNKDTGESRVISPAAEAVRVSNEHFEGENLDEVLDEVAHAIEDAGSGDGTVTGVKIGSTTYEPTDGVVDLSSPMSNKVDKETGKGLSTNDYTTADKTKLGSLPTNPVQTISVNGGTPATPVNGNVDISVEGAAGEDGITPHIGSNGHWWLGTTDTGINATGNDGQSITDADLVIRNALDGQGDVLGMSGAMLIRSNIDSLYASLNRLYGKLANMAFWDATDQAAAAPTALDWSLPKHSVAITNNLANSSITRNGESVGNSFQAEEGSTVTLIVAPASGYALTNVSYVKDGGSSTSATSLGDGTYKIEFVMGGSDVTIAVSGTAQQAYNVTLNLTNCSKVSGPTSVVSGGEATFVFAAAQGYALPSANPTVSGATITSWTKATGTLVIGSVTDAVTITIAAVQAFTGTINVKKITAWPSIDNSGNVTPVQGGETDYDMTIVDDSTIACSVDGSWKINIPNGYGLFSAVLKSNGTDVSDKIDFSTLVIDNASLTGTLVLELVVAEATDGMFLGKSFHYSEGDPSNRPGSGNFIEGGVPSNLSSGDDWCCMSEFVKAPVGANKIKFEFGNVLTSNTDTNQIQNKRGCLITYSNKGEVLGHFTIWKGGETYRVLDFPSTDGPNAVYARASFIDSLLNVSAISFSTDNGSTWTKVFDGSTKDITTT